MGNDGRGLDRQFAGILIEPYKASLKRIAWAYGCAKKGSEEEAKLLKILNERVLDDSPLTCKVCGCNYECPVCSDEGA